MSDSTGTQAATPQQVQRSAALSAPNSERHDAAGRYELRNEIARGGMGVVVRAWDVILRRDVAVKLLQPQFASADAERQFFTEATITAQLQHPGIPPIYDLGTFDDGRPFLAMKLVNGRTFDGLLKDRPDDRGQWIAVFEGICQAVGYAHSNGVIHRDLKPQNVMVGAFGEVQVMDWGLAKRLRSTNDPHGIEPQPASITVDTETVPGSAMGTPAYMPPEQARGEIAAIDERSDVFGLGAILCAILTGQPPFVGATAMATHQLAKAGDVGPAFERIESCGAEEEWKSLAKRCLAPAVYNRPANGAEVAEAVARLRSEAEARAQRAELDRIAFAVRTAEQRKRQRVGIGAALAVALVFAAGAGVSLWQMNRAIDAEGSTAQQLVKTREAKELAETNEKRANENESVALAAFNDMVFTFQNRLKGNPGTHDLRIELLNQAQAGLNKILANVENRESPDQILIGARIAKGDIERNLGNMAEALAQFRSALAAAERYASAEPENPGALRNVAIVHARLGDMMLETGHDEDDARRHYENALEIDRRLLDWNPNRYQALQDLASSIDSVANSHLKRGDLPRAKALYEESFAIRRSVAEERPEDLDAAMRLGISYTQLGDMALKLGDPSKAKDHFLETAGLYRALVDAEPGNSEYAKRLALNHLQLGWLALATGDEPEATRSYRKALTIAEAILDGEPANAEIRRLAYVFCSSLGEAAVKAGRKDDALLHYERGLLHGRKLIAVEPSNTLTAKRISLLNYNIGKILLSRKDYPTAIEHYRQYQASCRKHFDRFPNSAPARNELGLSSTVLSSALEDAGQLREALRVRQDALEAFLPLAAAEPDNFKYLRSVADCFQAIHGFAVELGEQRMEIDARDRLHEALGRLLRMRPEDREARGQFINTHRMYAVAELKANEIERGRDWFEKALGVASGGPRPEQFQREAAELRQAIRTCQMHLNALKPREVAPTPRESRRR